MRWQDRAMHYSASRGNNNEQTSAYSATDGMRKCDIPWQQLTQWSPTSRFWKVCYGYKYNTWQQTSIRETFLCPDEVVFLRLGNFLIVCNRIFIVYAQKTAKFANSHVLCGLADLQSLRDRITYRHIDWCLHVSLSICPVYLSLTHEREAKDWLEDCPWRVPWDQMYTTRAIFNFQFINLWLEVRGQRSR